jgi:hypothetical protein
VPDKLEEPGAAREAMPNAQELIDCIDAYFSSTDSFDVLATLSTMTPECVMEYMTDNRRYEGRDKGIKAYFERRGEMLSNAWHGNFSHVADPLCGRVATRFDVRRREKGGDTVVRDNINFFQFEGRLIKRISVWRSAAKEAA